MPVNSPLATEEAPSLDPKHSGSGPGPGPILALVMVMFGAFGWFFGRTDQLSSAASNAQASGESPPPTTVSPTAIPAPAPTSRPEWPSQSFRAPEFAENWRAAWQRQDLQQFMSYYADYIMVDGKPTSRNNYWNYHARENSKQPRMEIGLKNLFTRPAGPRKVVLTFEQNFQGWGIDPSNNWVSTGTTTLVVEQLSGNWKITRESYKRIRGGAF